MQDQEAIRAKPSKVKGRKKRDDPDFFEDYNVTEYVVVDGDNEYTESGSDDEEVLATQASLSRKGVQVSSAVCYLPFVVDNLHKRCFAQ